MSNKKRHIELEADKHLKEYPFGVGNGYFNALTENILNAAQASESDLEYNLHLKQNKMQVPDGYFNSLSKRVEERVEQEMDSSVTISIAESKPKRTRLRWMGIAASLLLVASIYFGSLFTDTTPQDQLAEISDEFLIEYLETESNFSEELITDIADIDIILDEIYMDETGDLTALLNEHPELEYNFEYYE